MKRLQDLRLESFSDRELLLLLIDLRNEDGLVTTEEIADALQLDHPNPYQCIGIRMSWMKRYGVVDHRTVRTRFNPSMKVWYLTSKGEGIAKGKLNAREERLFQHLHMFPEKGMNAAMALGDVYRSLSGVEAAMTRRAWRYATADRKR